jgi:excinuclease UvrABC nuclease subunit
VGLKTFDRKFGRDLLRELPAAPAVYLFKDEDGSVLYAGKAKNIRRRLQGYRNASRRKVHRKMRALVRAASSLEIRLQPSEREALLLENQLIREHRPRYNVDGAYTFLYPAIGLGVSGHQSLLCITTRREAFEGLGLHWHGVFRSRHRARDAFDALVALLDLIGHQEPRSRLRELPRVRGSRIVAFRRIEAWLPSLERLFAGESATVLRALATQLLEKPDARRDAAQVGEDLRLLDAFFASDARPLRKALRAAGSAEGYVSQDERDALFIAHRHRELPSARTREMGAGSSTGKGTAPS